jgi:hypothetical protein
LVIPHTAPISTPWTRPIDVAVLRGNFANYFPPIPVVRVRCMCTDAVHLYRSVVSFIRRFSAPSSCCNFSCWSGVGYLCSKNKRQRTAFNLSAVTEGAIKTFRLGTDAGPVEILDNRVDDQMANRLVPIIRSSTPSNFGNKVL